MSTELNGNVDNLDKMDDNKMEDLTPEDNDSEYDDEEETTHDKSHDKSISPPISQPRKYVKRSQDRRAKVSFQCNKKQLTLDSYSSKSSYVIQNRLSHLSVQLDVINKRLMQTVKIEDLDRKMHDMVNREEFQST